MSEKKKDEKIIKSTYQVVKLGYTDEKCQIPRKVVIKEISALQMLHIVDVVENAANKAEAIGMKEFQKARNNMEMNQRLLAIGITYPKPSEPEDEYILRLEENSNMIKLTPQKDVDEGVTLLLTMNDVQSFLARNLIGVLEQIALQVSIMARRIVQEQDKVLENSLNSSPKNTVGQTGK